MATSAVPTIDLADPRPDVRAFLTEQLRLVLEQRSVRFSVVALMLATASGLALVPTPLGVDTGWMFIVPVAISAIAGGLAEGVVIAFLSSVLCAVAAGVTGADPAVLTTILVARFALYGITSLGLGAFAEAHQSVASNLRALATRDPLTNVANVASFYEELGLLKTQTSSFAVLLVDVDDLKTLNDRYGHAVGSAAIRLVANTLRSVVRGSDHVARYGGDEFVVLLRQADRAGAQIVANRTREMLAVESLPGAPGVGVDVSIGVALYGKDGTTSDALLEAADAAMYADKRAHKAGRAVAV
ncbi:MAG: GGDEF domain-containing protein [Actinomycetota bacterium]